MTAEHHLSIPRTARYFLAGEPGPAVTDLWFCLHGYAQLASAFARHCQPLASSTALLVVPEALSRFYIGDHTRPAGPDAKIGASWMTREDRLTEITDYVQFLDRLYQLVAPQLPGRRRTHVLGFSQGASTATRWLTRGTTTANRLVLWGAPMPADLDPALDASRLRALEVVYVAGDRDEYLTEKVLASEAKRLTEMNVRFTTTKFAGGHVLDDRVLSDLAGG